MWHLSDLVVTTFCSNQMKDTFIYFCWSLVNSIVRSHIHICRVYFSPSWYAFQNISACFIEKRRRVLFFAPIPNHFSIHMCHSQLSFYVNCQKYCAWDILISSIRNQSWNWVISFFRLHRNRTRRELLASSRLSGIASLCCRDLITKILDPGMRCIWGYPWSVAPIFWGYCSFLS